MTDPEHSRYCGSRPFADTPHDRAIFFGREEEAHALMHLVLARRLVVVFARSGVGKTSLLQARLSEQLRIRGFFPLLVRVNDPRAGALYTIYNDLEKAVDGSDEIDFGVRPRGRLETAYGLAHRDGRLAHGALSLRHLADRPRRNGAPRKQDRPIPLWQFFQEARFWRGGDQQTPVLVIDQFEELFILHDRQQRRAFGQELAHLAGERIPRRILEQETRDGEPPPQELAPELKIVLTIREENLGSLEELVPTIPGILQERFRLYPLNRQQAHEAIVKPAAVEKVPGIATESFAYAPEAVAKILSFLCRRKRHGQWVPTDQVEPFQLQLICAHLESLIEHREPPRLVTLDDVGGGDDEELRRILRKFYFDATEKAAGTHRKLRESHRLRAIRNFCETGLIIDGRRVSTDEAVVKASFDISAQELQILTSTRLLQRVPRLDSFYYELSHDTLVRPILKAGETRRRRRREARYTWLAVMLTAALLGALAYSGYLNSKLEKAEATIAEMPIGTATVTSEPQTHARDDPILELIGLVGRVLKPGATGDAVFQLREALARTRETDRLLLTAEGVLLSVIDPIARRVYDSDEEGLIYRWDGFEKHRPTAIVRDIRQLAISPDGRGFGALNAEHKLGFYDSFGNVLARTPLPEDWGEVEALAYQTVETGYRIVAANRANRILSGAATASTLASEVNLPAGQPLSALAIAADGSLVASGGIDGSVRLWRWSPGSLGLKPVSEPFGPAALNAEIERRGEDANPLPPSPVRALAFTTAPQGIVTANDDGSLHLWDFEGSHRLGPLTGHEGPVLALGWDAEGETLLSRGIDDSLRFWDLSEPLLTATATEPVATALRRLCAHSLLRKRNDAGDPAAVRVSTECSKR